MKQQLSTLSFISDELNPGNVCPACPMVDTNCLYWVTIMTVDEYVEAESLRKVKVPKVN